jgi:prevent-host-death family protein
MRVSVAEAHDCLSQLLKEAQDHPVTITRRGEPVAVLVSAEEYEHLKRVRAYLEMLRLSELLRDRGVTASELFEASRSELEDRP